MLENAGANRDDTNEKQDDNNEKQGPRKQGPSCMCQNSKCLQLYCRCFKSGSYCDQECGCQNCENTVDNKEVRDEKRQAKLKRKEAAPSLQGRDLLDSANKAIAEAILGPTFSSNPIAKKAKTVACTSVAGASVAGPSSSNPVPLPAALSILPRLDMPNYIANLLQDDAANSGNWGEREERALTIVLNALNAFKIAFDCAQRGPQEVQITKTQNPEPESPEPQSPEPQKPQSP